MVPTPAPLHLAVALDGAGWHPAAWREPDAQPQRLFTAGYWTELARHAERGLLDFLTIEDGLDLQSDARIFTGTAIGLADLLQEWQEAGLSGFRLRPAVLPHDLTQLTDRLVPELRRRCLFRARYEADTLVSPATVLEAVDGYRAAFQPSAELGRPYVSVSADVVVAGTEAAARELAPGYGLWVRSIRTAEGAIQFPTPGQARRHVWSEADRELVADRIDTQFTGTPSQVADQLERLRDATEADELIITTITHDHADRVRSYQLLAEEWARR